MAWLQYPNWNYLRQDVSTARLNPVAHVEEGGRKFLPAGSFQLGAVIFFPHHVQISIVSEEFQGLPSDTSLCRRNKAQMERCWLVQFSLQPQPAGGRERGCTDSWKAVNSPFLTGNSFYYFFSLMGRYGAWGEGRGYHADLLLALLPDLGCWTRTCLPEQKEKGVRNIKNRTTQE